MELLPTVSVGGYRFNRFSTKATDCESQIPGSRSPKHVKILRKLGPALVTALVALSPICNTPVAPALSVDIQRGASLFRQACIGCHDAGGNILQPGATLFTKDLQRNGVDKEEEIFRITYFGKGRMPGFGEKCTPRGQCTFGPRLQDEEIKLLADFVRFQADQGWPNVPSGEDMTECCYTCHNSREAAVRKQKG